MGDQDPPDRAIGRGKSISRSHHRQPALKPTESDNDPTDDYRPAIEVDDRSTWPSRIAEVVDVVATKLQGSTTYTADLAVSPEEETAFRVSLSPYFVRAYHATRLLPHEADNIRERGLLTLTPELMDYRIQAAYENGFITDAQRLTFAKANVFAEPDGATAGRTGQTCLFISSQLLDNDVDAVERLITIWGGEGLYMSRSGSFLTPTLGIPSIVVADIDLSVDPSIHCVWPGVLRCFVAQVLGLSDIAADVMYKIPIAPTRIRDIWQPGQPEFDRHEELLRVAGGAT